MPSDGLMDTIRRTVRSVTFRLRIPQPPVTARRGATTGVAPDGQTNRHDPALDPSPRLPRCTAAAAQPTYSSSKVTVEGCDSAPATFPRPRPGCFPIDEPEAALIRTVANSQRPTTTRRRMLVLRAHRSDFAGRGYCRETERGCGSAPKRAVVPSAIGGTMHSNGRGPTSCAIESDAPNTLGPPNRPVRAELMRGEVQWLTR